MDAVFDYLSQVKNLAPENIRQTLLNDYLASGARANPHCLKGLLQSRSIPAPRAARSLAKRQRRDRSNLQIDRLGG